MATKEEFLNNIANELGRPLTELIILNPFFVTLYVSFTFSSVKHFEEIRLDIEETYAYFSISKHSKITKCFKIRFALMKSLQQWAFCFGLKR